MFEIFTLFGILAFGTAAFWGFWAAFFVLAIVLSGLTETEHWGWASALIVVGFAAMYQSNIFNVLNYAGNHKADFIWWIGKYILAGVVWATLKWWRFVIRNKSTYKEAKQKFLADNNAADLLSDDMKAKWSTLLADKYSYRDVSPLPPATKDHKEKIVNWIAFWPFSILGTVLYDFLRELWDAIYDAVVGLYDRIAEAIYADVKGDVMTKDQMVAFRKGLDEKAKKVEDEEYRRTHDAYGHPRV